MGPYFVYCIQHNIPMLSYHWGWLWHEECGPSFPSGLCLQKRCHYLILCHPLVYITSIYPNHVYMIIHPSFNFNFYNFDKNDSTNWTLFVIQVFLSSTSILHERPKFIFLFQIFDINHIKTKVKRQPMMKGVMKCWCFGQCIPLSPLCSIRIGRFTFSPRFGVGVLSVRFQRGS